MATRRSSLAEVAPLGAAENGLAGGAGAQQPGLDPSKELGRARRSAEDELERASREQLEKAILHEISRESMRMPSVWRTLACAILAPLGLELDTHVSNVGSEMRLEAVWRNAASRTCKGQALYTTIGTSKDKGSEVVAKLLDGIEEYAKEVRKEYDEEVRKAKEASLTPPEPRLPLCNLRFSAGETLLHWSALTKKYDILFFLLRLEPMLLATVYQRNTFRGESVLHILVAHEDLAMIRRLAQFALFYEEPSDARERKYCEGAWGQLAEVEGVAGTMEWRRAWMCDAFRAIVNGRCDGTFFEATEKGGACYYGGTPVSIAVSLGSMAIVRFLTLEVGCTCRQCWECCSSAAAGAEQPPRLAELYPCAHSIPTSCWELQDWDVSVTARLDLPDAYGNTAGHMAVYHHATPEVFGYLERLYSAGFGRYDNRSEEQEKIHAKLARPATAAAAAAAAGVPKCTLTVHKIPRYFPLGADHAHSSGDSSSSSSSSSGSERKKIELAHLRAGLEALKEAHSPGAGLAAFPTFCEAGLSAGEGGEQQWTLELSRPVTESQNRGLDLLSDILAHGRRLEIRRDEAAVLHFSLPLSVDIGFAASPRHYACGSEEHTAARAFPGAPVEGAPAVAKAGLFKTLKRALERERESPPSFFTQTFTWVDAAGADASSSPPPSPPLSMQKQIEQQESTGERRRLLDVTNFKGFTPLTLAVYMGKRGLFDALWEGNTFSPLGKGKPFWTWGGTSGIVYPLDQVDDLGQIQDDLTAAPGPAQHWLRLWWKHCLGLPLPQQQAGAAAAATATATAATAAPAAEGPLGSPTPPPGVALSPTTHFFYWKERSHVLGRNLLKTLLWWLPLPWSSATHRQPTALDILVRYNRWMMLEPKTTADYLTRDLTRATSAATLASQALYRHHQKEELTEEKAADLYSASLREAERLLSAGARERGDKLEGKDLLLTTRAKAQGAGGGSAGGVLDDSSSKINASDSVLEQLAERKWERLYSVLFVRLALFRCLAVLVAWGLLVTRSGAPLNLSVCSPAAPPELCLGGVHVMSGLVWAIFAGASAVFVVNALPFLRFIVWPGLVHWSSQQAVMREQQEVGEGDSDHPFLATRGEDEPMEATSREEMLYVAAHGGKLGSFYTATLLCGSGLLLAGAMVDLWGGGWSAAYLIYAFGALCSCLHLLYYLIGSTVSGPLLVMVVSTVLKQVLRWAHIFVPCVFSLAFMQYVIDAMPRGAAEGATSLAADGVNSFFKDFVVGWILDNTFNNVPSSDALNASHARGDVHGRNTTLLLWIVIIYTLTIVLTSLLIAMLTDAFTEQQDRKSDFLIERLRACMLLESSMTGIERYFGARERDRYWLLTKPASPIAKGLLPPPATQLALRPHFMCLQPSQRPVRSATGSADATVAAAAAAGGGGGGGGGGRGHWRPTSLNLTHFSTAPPHCAADAVPRGGDRLGQQEWGWWGRWGGAKPTPCSWRWRSSTGQPQAAAAEHVLGI